MENYRLNYARIFKTNLKKLEEHLEQADLKKLNFGIEEFLSDYRKSENF